MSDLMFYGVLRMPFDLTMSGEISRRQFYDRAQEAADRVEKAEAREAELLARIETLMTVNEKLACQVADKEIPRTPTEAMLNAARDWSVKKYSQGIGNDAAIGCWQAMYDCAQADESNSNRDAERWRVMIEATLKPEEPLAQFLNEEAAKFEEVKEHDIKTVAQQISDLMDKGIEFKKTHLKG